MSFRTLVRKLFAPAPVSPDHTRRPALGLQALEAREVPAITLANGVLTITDSGYADSVRVYRDGSNVVATQRYSGSPIMQANITKSYAAGLVSSISAALGAGDDSFRNDTSLTSSVSGGTGNDVLRGGSGTDVLNGGANNDRLYGGSGNDTLIDPSGVNGLFGGLGTDSLFGGSGSDRFLDTAGDSVSDLGGNNAHIDFTDTFGFVYLNSADGPVTYTGAAWTDTDIIRVDAGLAAVHEGMGNPTFLKYDGSSIDVRRVGENLTNPTSGVNGWNGDTGVITITQTGLTQNDGDLAHTVIHEIGHNWDESNENASVAAFRDISGWQPYSGALPPGYSRYDDSSWVYKSDAKFTRDYAKTDPLEDFADSFAAYWLHKAGITTTKFTLNGFNGLPDKMSYMDGFVNSL